VWGRREGGTHTAGGGACEEGPQRRLGRGGSESGVDSTDETLQLASRARVLWKEDVPGRQVARSHCATATATTAAVVVGRGGAMVGSWTKVRIHPNKHKFCVCRAFYTFFKFTDSQPSTSQPDNLLLVAPVT